MGYPRKPNLSVKIPPVLATPPPPPALEKLPGLRKRYLGGQKKLESRKGGIDSLIFCS